MHHDFLDRYSRLDSPVHRASASLKLVTTLSLVALTVAVPVAAISYLATLGAGLLAVAVVARIPLRYLGWRLLLLEPFVLGVAVLTLFQPGGLVVFLTILIKSTLCLLTMVLLANTTPFAELLRVLRRAGAPAIFVTALALLYRYLFVLVDEAERMHRARACRTFTNKRSHRWRTLATVVGQLFVRSTERAERIYAAMLARGWQ
jgi:cobalt/nickel transport system permease protein